MKHYDVAVIGGGIVGLAHAWMASRRGLSVALFERSSVAQGASVRNFGMIWPIGQPQGERYELAKRSRELWLELGASGVLDVEECGSIHLAHREDEWSLLEEFCSLGTHEAELVTAGEVVKLSQLANPEGLRGGMVSSTELRVDPRTASASLADWLSSERNVDAFFETSISVIQDQQLVATDARTWAAERIVVCSGSDLQTLYPEVLLRSGLVLCKLQMMRSVAQPGVERTPHLASGLTLRHYESFEQCSSLERLRARIAEETPELDRFGIHVMASPFPGGEVVLGDSHEYGDQITPFDQSEIDELMIRELRKIIRLDDWTMVQRWHGVYAKHPSLPIFESETPDGNHVFVGPGGAGMTMSFALAERAWNRWTGSTQ